MCQMPMKRILCVILLCASLVSLFAVVGQAAPAADSWEVSVSASQAGSKIHMQQVEGKNYLFLPSYFDVTALPLTFTSPLDTEFFSVTGSRKAMGISSGEKINLPELCGEGSEYSITLNAKKGSEVSSLELTVLPIENVATMCLVSDDPVNQGRAWVESSPDKSNKATGSLFMADAQGETVYDGKLTQIKGRGNSTWLAEKKPYQIKLSDKTDLLQTGDKANKAKTWVLLTNAADATGMRNNLVYDMSVAVGMIPGIESRPVSLFYDGEYRGSYLLCEKVEINSGRVDIADLEKQTEKANSQVEDFDALSTAVGKTENGATYVYCEGLTSPENITGGYLLEMDTPSRAAAEKCYLITSRGNHVVVKSPEFATKEEMAYIASYYQDFEDTVYNEGKHPSNGKGIESYADVDSLAQCYIVNELTKNPDGYRTSTYLYKDADNDVMTFGPIWDYDLSFGLSFGEFTHPCESPEEFFTIHSLFTRALYQIPSFRQAVHDLYLEDFSPKIENVLLNGTHEAAPMQSFGDYTAEMSSSANANGKLWDISYSTWLSSCDYLRNYIATRNAWLTKAFGTWNAETAEDLPLYVDILKTDWYYEEVMKASQYGIMNGMSNGIFAPQESSTRAQGAKVLYAISGSQEVTFKEIFSDVSNIHWFAPAVIWGYENGVVTGHDDGTFKPDMAITRQDMVVLLYRYLGSPATKENLLNRYGDAAQVSSYARNAVEWALENGILNGYEDATIHPQNEINRAELAAIMVRYYENFVR